MENFTLDTTTLRQAIDNYGTQQIEAAVRFYETSPDGQYDEMVAHILSILVEAIKLK